jgi:hypothetical protein
MKASENTITFVRFGGNHKWWQRIQEWNSETPNDAFSLIEITPASYKECDMQK